MNGIERNKTLDNEANSVASSATETKRRAARRRFLARGTAAGSGLLIVTLYHQRSFANTQQGHKVYVSSPELCKSIGGKKIQWVERDDSVSKNKKVMRVECQLP